MSKWIKTTTQEPPVNVLVLCYWAEGEIAEAVDDPTRVERNRMLITMKLELSVGEYQYPHYDADTWAWFTKPPDYWMPLPEPPQ